MGCMVECLLASGFIGASLYVMIRDKSVSHQELYNTLSDEKKEAFKKIKKERLMIYIRASLIGLFISISFSKFGKFLLPDKSFDKSCINTLIFFGVQSLTYRIHPKSDWMLNHIDNNKQAKLWLKKYKYMSKRWHIGMVIGLIGYFVLNILILNRKAKSP